MAIKVCKTVKGFTLVGILLILVFVMVMVVVSTSYMQQKTELIRIDKTVGQIQYILNAGMAYYVMNGSWPGTVNTWSNTSGTNTSSLQPNFLPARAINNPFGTTTSYYYHTYTDYNMISPTLTPAQTFQVWVYIGTSTQQQALANAIANRVPNGHPLPSSSSFYGYLVAYVPIPGTDMNDATAMNFAGMYHHGACIPAPVCPTDASGNAMTPEVFVVPTSTSGVNDSGSSNIYPISSFSAYATGNNPLDANPPLCTNETTVNSGCGGGGTNNQYWRACMQVVTTRGNVQSTRTDTWGSLVSLIAFTRCSIQNEASGSNFSVYGN